MSPSSGDMRPSAIMRKIASRSCSRSGPLSTDVLCADGSASVRNVSPGEGGGVGGTGGGGPEGGVGDLGGFVTPRFLIACSTASSAPAIPSVAALLACSL